MPVSAQPLVSCFSIALNGGLFHVDCWCEFISQTLIQVTAKSLVYCTFHNQQFVHVFHQLHLIQ